MKMFNYIITLAQLGYQRGTNSLPNREVIGV